MSMIQLIQTAALSQNANQKQAENTIIQLREQNPSEFVKQVCAVLSNKDIPDHIRQAAGTIFVVSLKHRNSNGQGVWDCIQPSERNTIKNQILGVLIDQSRIVRRSAANIVARICFIQLPRNQWDGIVEKICQNISHDSPIVKESSILTLGFICENLKENTSFKLPPQLQENILSGITLGLQQNENILKQTALKALENSMNSFRDILKNQQYREFILKQIVDIISSKKQLLIEGLQTLSEYTKNTYQTLGIYIVNIYGLLAPIISNNSSGVDDEQDACIAAMQILETIASYYKDYNSPDNKLDNYFTGELGHNIVTQLLKNLLIMQDSDKIEDNPISDSASKALQSIFQAGSSQFKELVMNFIASCNGQNNWKFQQASIKAFSLLLVGLSAEQNQQLISTSFNQLIQLLNHNSIQVQYATFESLVIITEICGEIIVKSEHFVEYLKMITGKISTSENFMHKGCKIIENLCQAQKDLQLGKFNDIADHLIQFLLKICTSNQSSLSVVDWSVEAILSIIQVMSNQQVSLKYLKFSLDNFDSIDSLDNKQKRQQLYSVFFTLMQYSLHTLKNNKQIQMSLLTNVYQKVVAYFQSINDVTADGLYAVQALASFFSNDLRLVEDFWKYIIHALNKWQDSAILKSALSCIAFFTSCYGQSFGNKIGEFFPNMIKLIQDQSFNRENKLDILIFLGEIFLNCGRAALPYLDQFMSVIMLCCQASISLKQTDPVYYQNLREIVIESIKCVVHGMSQYQQTKQILQKYNGNIFKFVEITCQKNQTPTVKYLDQSIMLLGDLSKFFPQLSHEFKGQMFIKNCVNLLINNNQNGDYNNTIRYAKMQFG